MNTLDLTGFLRYAIGEGERLDPFPEAQAFPLEKPTGILSNVSGRRFRAPGPETTQPTDVHFVNIRFNDQEVKQHYVTTKPHSRPVPGDH